MLSARADWLVWRWLAKFFSSLGSQRALWTSLPPHYGQLRGDCGVCQPVSSLFVPIDFCTRTIRTQIQTIWTVEPSWCRFVTDPLIDSYPSQLSVTVKTQEKSLVREQLSIVEYEKLVKSQASKITFISGFFYIWLYLLRKLVTFFSIASYYFAIAQ